MTEKQQKTESIAPNHWGLFWIGLIIVVIAAIGIGGVVYARTYAHRLLPGVHIGSVDVGGKTPEEARELVAKTVAKIINNGFVFEINGANIIISPIVISPEDPDLSRELVTFDVDQALDQGFELGHKKNPIKNIVDQLQTRIFGKTIMVPVDLDFEEIQTRIINSSPKTFTPKKDAKLVFSFAPDGSWITNISEEQAGNTFDVHGVSAELERSLNNLEHPRLTINIIPDESDIKTEQARALISQADQFLNRGPWTLTFENQAWTISPEKMSGMIIIKMDASTRRADLGLGAENLDLFFTEIEKQINRPPRNAKFSMQDGRVVEFEGSQTGIELDEKRTKERMEVAFIINQNATTEVATAVAEPEVSTAEVNDLGIKEILGVGVSNFRGSPTNRVKNIQNGARLVNGSLIPPGEEFSLLSVLRPFTKENGYLEGLVINGDKIELAVGGGLCQIGTTTFRGAMKSGLPVTARQNHSLVVSYYNDPSNGNPGTDATIYDPAPDLRFKNDTGAHLLITTEVDVPNTELRFIFWGTPDGRKGSYTPPVVKNWVAPGETKYIETTDLEAGKEECQHAYTGANTEFTYTITRPDGKKEETIFTSHYRALPEICLVGIEKIDDTEGGAGEASEAEDET